MALLRWEQNESHTPVAIILSTAANPFMMSAFSESTVLWAGLLLLATITLQKKYSMGLQSEEEGGRNFGYQW